jgi:hypothetical protein
MHNRAKREAFRGRAGRTRKRTERRHPDPMPFAFYDRLSPARRRIYDRSDAIVELPLPPGEDPTALAGTIVTALAGEREGPVQQACERLLGELTRIFAVPPLRARVYAVRPNGDWGELHGMYLPADEKGDAKVEVWMRTAQRQKIVAPRTFLRTLVHEFCHHLDYEHFELAETFHTEGFYKRESHLLTQIAGPSPRNRPAQDQPSTTRTGTRGARAQRSS